VRLLTRILALEIFDRTQRVRSKRRKVFKLLAGWEAFVARQNPFPKQELEMDLKVGVLRREVKQYRGKSARITERLLSLTEVAKRSGSDGALSELECERIAVQFGIGARTLRRWVAAYEQGGVEAIVPRRNTGRKALPIRGHTAKKIVEYRQLYRWGAEVIQAHLLHDHGIDIGRYRIERYLKRKGLLLAPRRK
jgi:transposase